MLVICEDCAKKYNIDESRIKGKRARFTCNECGHIIIVEKSDLARPLVRGSQHVEEKKETTVDLLKEMEAPLTDEHNTPSEQQSAGQEKTAAENEPIAVVIKKKKSTSISGYFLIGGIISFLLVNGAIAFILVQHYSNIPIKQMEQHSGMFLTAGLVLCGTWAVSLVIFFVMGSLLARKVNSLSSAVERIIQGEREVTVAVKGPAELSNMAGLLAQLSKKVK